MAQHDFVPAWLNFSTPQPAKSPAANLEKQAEPHHRDGRTSASRRRHNSSDGFFNNGSLHAPAGNTGDGWQQLLRHDSVDSGVAKGGQGGLVGGSCWKETPSWHGAPRGAPDSLHHQGRQPKRGAGERDRQAGHRQRNGNFHPRKGPSYQDKFPNEERKDKDDKLKFVEEDFPSLNPEMTGKHGTQTRALPPHAGVWENPPSGKQMVSKMLVIKKVSKEDSSTAFSAGFATAGALPNGKAPITGSSVYKNLVPKPAVAPTKSTQWKAGGREVSKSGLHVASRDSVFTSPMSAAKPSTPNSAPQHNAPKEHPSSTTPPIDIAPSRLKLMRRGPDRKSEFLRTLKDEGTGELTTSSSPGTSGEGESSTPEPKAYSEEVHENGLSCSLSDSDTEHLSSSLEAEHRLLKAMGWQEYPENDDNFLPLTEDELKEFQTKTEQLKKNGIQRNGVLPRARGVTLHFTPWRSVAEAHVEEGSESDTSSSSQTSDDDDDCIKS